jgi:hypothetical protein
LGPWFLGYSAGFEGGASSREKERWKWGVKKEYKIRILDSGFERILVEWLNPDSSLTWWKLDGRKLRFRNDVRPAGKYVFYHFAAQLRRNWSQRQGHEVLKVQWGFKGEYIPSHMLKTL